MNVLVACEESQAVCKAFRELGHVAYSCDIQECSGGHPEWHIQGDVLPLLNGNCTFQTADTHTHTQTGQWDLIIAHPPCTYLSNVATRHFSLRCSQAEKVVKRWEERAIAAVFFMRFALADCPRIAVENPIGFMSKAYKKPDQIIHPWMFANSENDSENYVTKATCLWLKGLPRLETNILPKPDNRKMYGSFPCEKVKTSIERLKAFEPKNGEGYYLAFSGGKDSVVCKALMDMAGVKYDSTYRVTSVDPPELVQFIKEKHPDVKREVPRYKNEFDAKGNPKPITMWNLIPRKMYPPTRIARYCCQYLKESGGDGRMTVTGVRWAESNNRKRNQGIVTLYGNSRRIAEDTEGVDGVEQTPRGGFVLTNDNDDARMMVESCYKRHKTVVNPIIEWTDSNVWEFIKAESVPYCGLYDEGLHRLGCIGCPMAMQRGREKEFLRWPKYKTMYLRAFDKMLELRKERNRLDPSRPVWKTGGAVYAEPTAMDVYNMWMEYKIIPGQLDLFDMMEEEDDDE